MPGAASPKTATRKKKTTKKKTATVKKTTRKQVLNATSKAKKTETARRKTKRTASKASTKARSASRAAGAKPKRSRETSESRLPQEILGELRALRASIEARPVEPMPADAALDDAVLSMRRLLNELIDRRMEAFVATLADLRASLASAQPDLQRATDQLDRLIDELGVIRFEAEPSALPDPLIHTVVGERTDPSAADGVVLETLDPGLRSGAGPILTKARVLVNRRP